VATLVYETTELRSDDAGPVVLRLVLAETGTRTEIWIEREQRLPHKTLQSIVLRIEESSSAIAPLARAMTTVVHELERLHRQGYSVRERAGGGWSGKWHTDLVRRRGARPALAWPSDLRKAAAKLGPLEAALSELDVPRPEFDEPADHAGQLAAAMRRHGAEVRRIHAVDAAIAADPAQPADELLEALEEQGLLSPPDPDDSM